MKEREGHGDVLLGAQRQDEHVHLRLADGHERSHSFIYGHCLRDYVWSGGEMGGQTGRYRKGSSTHVVYCDSGKLFPIAKLLDDSLEAPGMTLLD
jgi:hypothetical protein